MMLHDMVQTQHMQSLQPVCTNMQMFVSYSHTCYTVPVSRCCDQYNDQHHVSLQDLHNVGSYNCEFGHVHNAMNSFVTYLSTIMLMQKQSTCMLHCLT